MSTKKKLLEAAAGNAGGEATYVDDVFSTYLYEGTGTAQDIVNGVDLAGGGGMVWIKSRDAVHNHGLFDTERGAGKLLASNSADGELDYADVTSFNSDGFTAGYYSGWFNSAGDGQASWTFRKAPSFFDVVTYTGDSVAGREIPHNLGVEPGMIIVKRLTGSDNWQVFHKDLSNPLTKRLYLNSELAEQNQNSSTPQFPAMPTDSVFTVGRDTSVNGSPQEYVAYLFAHDDSDEGMIQCGSFSSTSASSIDIDLGWEPQWLLAKTSGSNGGWSIFDSQRGFVGSLGGDTAGLVANEPNAEATYTNWALNSRGFSYLETSSSRDFIYMAIRRPNKPASEFEADELFAIDTRFSAEAQAETPPLNYYSGFPVDLEINSRVTGGGHYVYPRLAGGSFLKTETTDAEVSNASVRFQSNVGLFPGSTYSPDTTKQSFMWRRAHGFFDVVCYEGDGSPNSVIPHNLGVAPEMMILKSRDITTSWIVYHKDIGNTKAIYLNKDNAETTASSGWWDNTTPTDTVFTVGANPSQSSWGSVVSYLFASVDGISKVGSYTGTGNDLNVDCGFSAGARFILIKRTDNNGDWYVYDSVRGIVAGDDPYFLLNSTASQTANTDYIDPLNAGFTVTSSAPAALNNNGGTYIFYAIA
jgi:hypothetical protein